MKYVDLVRFKDDVFEVDAATITDGAKQVLSAGFDYEKSGIMLFGLPKRFTHLGNKCRNLMINLK
jgi:hypothetical protein